MMRKNILWLVSWYPNKGDRYTGDFIQRHARAASLHHNIHVIYVTHSEKDETEINKLTGLTEEIIYIKNTGGLFRKIWRQYKWRKAHLDAIDNYIKVNGKPEIIHVHVPWKAGLIGLYIKKKYQIAYVLTEHWGIYNKVVEDNYFKQPVYRRNFIREIFKNSRLFISASQFLAKEAVSILGNKEYTIIPNVVDTSLFYKSGNNNSVFTFIHVSNMVPLKNVKGILEAFYELKKKSTVPVRLVLVGNNGREFKSNELFQPLINDSIFFRGEVSYAEVAEEMRKSDCFILNSIMENAPCVISEALCCGIPVIATNTGGIPEMINEKNGKLIPVNNNGALKHAMEAMMNEKHLFDKEAISRNASDRYSYAVIAEAFNRVYSSVL